MRADSVPTPMLLFYHPDFTVGGGISPHREHSRALRRLYCRYGVARDIKTTALTNPQRKFVLYYYIINVEISFFFNYPTAKWLSGNALYQRIKL